VELLKRLFANPYDSWYWSTNSSRYLMATTAPNITYWQPPTLLCNSGMGPRLGYANDYCAILPAAKNVKVNGTAVGSVTLTPNQFINLTFNTTVDTQQTPLVMYAIDWGDQLFTTVTGVEMRERPNENNPHSFYHLYSYWDLKTKDNQGAPTITCTTVAGVGECRLKPRLMVKDNWGWCNAGSVTYGGPTVLPTGMNDCDQWVEFGGEIVVRER
jgi:hypothetical protein